MLFRSPGALAAEGGQLLAASGDKIVRLSASGQITPVPITGIAPAGIAAGTDGRIYVSDKGTHTVKSFDRTGKPVGEIGKPGGAYAGAYDPQRMVNPRGLVGAANGWLWVTEDRWNPKRLVAWDLKNNQVVKEKFGPTSYGASEIGRASWRERV